MRIAPLVFCLTGKPQEERFRMIKAVSSITHAHELSVVSCYIYLEMLQYLLSGMDKQTAYNAVQKGFCALGVASSPYFSRLLGTNIGALPSESINSSGFVIDTLEAAFWCLLTTKDYKSAVLKAVNLGDDTDTTAAVTGALAGLAYGLASIPLQWLDELAAREDICAKAENIP